MIRKKVLGIGASSATLLVQDTEANGELRVLRRINVSGWPAAEARAAQDVFNELHKSNVPGMVRVHAVLMQNSFLNVATDFCAGGDLAAYLEEELEGPLSEKQALVWLLVLAQSLQHLHGTTKLPCHGPSLDRVYLDSVRGTAGILNGLPLCRHMYLAKMTDRRTDGAAVATEYPPEMLQSREYHPQLSDVWHLGHVGTQLLSANTHLGSRSAAARQLLSRMTDPSLQKRMPLDEAVDALKAIVGDVKLRKPAARPTRAGTSASSTGENSSGSTTATGAVTVAPAPALSTKGATSPIAFSPPDVPVTVPNRAVHSSADTNSSANGTVSLSDGAAPSDATRPQPRPASRRMQTPPPQPQPQVQPRHRDAAVTSSTMSPPSPRHQQNAQRGQRAGAVESSWHRKAEEQFAELQRMNASPPAQRHVSRPGSPRESAAGVGNTSGRRSSPRALTALSNQLPPPPNRRSPSASAAPSSARGSGVLDNNTRVLNEMFAEREALAARQERVREEAEWRRRRQAALEQRAHRERAQHQTNLRQIREDDGRQADIRKHLREWKERQVEELAHGYGDNVVVLANDNVTILAPRPAPPERPPPRHREEDEEGDCSAPPAAAAGHRSRGGKGNVGRERGARGAGRRRLANDGDDDDDYAPNHNQHVPVTILMPKNQPPPPPSPQAAPAPPSPEAASLQETRPTPSSLSSAGYVTPSEAAEDAPQPSIAVPPPAAAPPPPRHVSSEEGAPRTRVPTPQGRSPPPRPLQRPTGSPASAHPQVPHGRQRPSPPPQPPQPPMPFVDMGRRSSPVNPAVADVSTIATLEWTIDGLRSAIRSLLGNRTLYGDAMMAVADFVSRGEEARVQPRENDAFMIHMRSLIPDDRVFGAAAPMCVQLVALEGLYQTVRENGSAVPRAAR